MAALSEARPTANRTRRQAMRISRHSIDTNRGDSTWFTFFDLVFGPTEQV